MKRERARCRTTTHPPCSALHSDRFSSYYKHLHDIHVVEKIVVVVVCMYSLHNRDIVYARACLILKRNCLLLTGLVSSLSHYMETWKQYKLQRIATEIDQQPAMKKDR